MPDDFSFRATIKLRKRESPEGAEEDMTRGEAIIAEHAPELLGLRPPKPVPGGDAMWRKTR